MSYRYILYVIQTLICDIRSLTLACDNPNPTFKPIPKGCVSHIGVRIILGLSEFLYMT